MGQIDFSLMPEIREPRFIGQRIKIWLEPPGKLLSIPRIKTAMQLLSYFNLDQETALVARNGKLLTPDRRIWPDDEILIRVIFSHG